MQTQEVLKQCTVSGNIVKLPSVQLDRKIYQEVSKSLELIGGKWKGGKVAGFVFLDDPSELLQDILNGEKRNLKKEFQFFGTPSDLAREMVYDADIKDGDIISEPEAGQGAIVDEIIKVANSTNKIFLCEMMPVNMKVLLGKYSGVDNVHFLSPVDNDFLNMDNSILFNKIIANPPFSKNQDIDHIYKMYSLLKPGGRIVSIASKHWLLSENKKEKAFKEWIYDTVQADVNTVGAGAFSESGTKIDTVKIIIDKP